MVESANENGYKVTFISTETRDAKKRSAYTLYEYEIIGPDGTYRMSDRYSRIKQFVDIITQNLKKTDGLPVFPEKRIFKTMNK